MTYFEFLNDCIGAWIWKIDAEMRDDKEGIKHWKQVVSLQNRILMKWGKSEA